MSHRRGSSPSAARPVPGPVRVLLVDDHPIVHQGVERLVEGASDLHLCSAALTATAAVRAVARERPDVVLLDLHLPDMSAPVAAAALRSARPNLKLLLFTGDSRRNVAHVVALVGMDGVVHKDNACSTLIRAIRAVAAGQRFYDPLIGGESSVVLSRREFQILERMAKGDNNGEIGRHLGLTANTVKSYVQTLLTRLDARNRLDAVLKAQQAGLL
ncbi:response regulator transcription factor [Pseudonocardia sp. RS010]|uniref:response regulator transcription factor n=1 Tax=Pseudonocardia sp. RS010 TaxID=3385979 RepID=UPI00399EFA71